MTPRGYPTQALIVVRPILPSWLRSALEGACPSGNAARSSAWTHQRHHRFLLQLHMQQINALEAGIAELDQEVDAGLACFRDAVERLSTHGPGSSH
jgi:hypothetical protein